MVSRNRRPHEGDGRSRCRNATPGAVGGGVGGDLRVGGRQAHAGGNAGAGAEGGEVAADGGVDELQRRVGCDPAAVELTGLVRETVVDGEAGKGQSPAQLIDHPLVGRSAVAVDPALIGARADDRQRLRDVEVPVRVRVLVRASAREVVVDAIEHDRIGAVTARVGALRGVCIRVRRRDRLAKRATCTRDVVGRRRRDRRRAGGLGHKQRQRDAAEHNANRRANRKRPGHRTSPLPGMSADPPMPWGAESTSRRDGPVPRH